MLRNNINSLFLILLLVLGVIVEESFCQIDLGSMESWGFNGVSSDDVTLMSEKKIKIENLRYTGEGPAAWFMVGKEGDDYNQEFTDLDGVIIPDESGGCDRLGRYRGDDVELTLPGDMKFTDYQYLSIYCIRFSHNFGYIPIKKGLTFPTKNATAPAQEEQDDLPAECPQNPETRGGSEEEEDDLEDEEEE